MAASHSRINPTPARPSGRHTHGRPGLSRRRPALCRYHTPADNPARRSPDSLPQRTEGIRQTACRTPGYRGGQHRTPVKTVVDRRAVVASAADSGHSKNAVPSCTPCAPNCITLAIPAPSMMPPAATTGMVSRRRRSCTRVKVLSCASGACGAKIPGARPPHSPERPPRRSPAVQSAAPPGAKPLSPG